MQLWQILILAVIQGVAEFLPISSSGHVVVFASLLAQEGTPLDLEVADLNIVLHFGSLLSIVFFYRRRIIELLGKDRRVIPLLILGTLPAAIIGLGIKRMFPQVLESPLLAGCLLVLNAAILWCASKIGNGSEKYEDLKASPVLGIGMAQAVAVLPGISRSGATISAGILAGLNRVDAATFSFLLAIPAIGGACLLEAIDLYREPHLTTPWHYLAIGAGLTFVVGLMALRVLMRLLEHGKLAWFAAWCLGIGVFAIAWQLWLRV